MYSSACLNFNYKHVCQNLQQCFKDLFCFKIVIQFHIANLFDPVRMFWSTTMLFVPPIPFVVQYNNSGQVVNILFEYSVVLILLYKCIKDRNLVYILQGFINISKHSLCILENLLILYFKIDVFFFSEQTYDTGINIWCMRIDQILIEISKEIFFFRISNWFECY